MNTYLRLGIITLLSCLLVEIASYAAYFFPLISPLIGGMIVITVLIVSFKNLRFGLLILAAELVIGSQGYLFSLSGASGGFSLRIAMWIIIMTVWLLKTLSSYRRDKRVLWSYLSWRYSRPLVLLAAGIILGISVGLLAGNDLTYLFLDGKRWIFALILLPFFDYFREHEDIKTLLVVSGAAALWLSLKTLILVFIFSHTFIPLVFDLYGWMRLDLLGEITRLPNGFSRVFIQSQLYLIPLFFASVFICADKSFNQFVHKSTKSTSILLAVTGIISAAALTACLSRSFWVAIAAAICVWIITQSLFLRQDWKRFFRSGIIMALTALLGIGLVFAVALFPYPKPGVIDGSLLSERATQFEAGAASRWSLLPVLWNEVSKSPLWGRGFGVTATYVTSDPRVVLHTTDGKYTTYAFEWGWLDIWLKTGLLGLAGYIWLLSLLLRDAFILIKRGDTKGLIIGLSVISLAIIHFFTPYLNHPLGFGYLIIAMIVLTYSLKNKDA